MNTIAPSPCIGDIWRSNDKRTQQDDIEVKGVNALYVWVYNPCQRRHLSVHIARFGMCGRRGYSLVSRKPQ